MIQKRIRRYITGATSVEIAAGIEAAVAAAELGPGDPLPTIRSLASELCVSPTTVSAAFAELKRRGMIVTRGRRGSEVSQRPPLAATAGRSPLPKGVLDLSLGNPDPDLLPELGTALREVKPGKRLYETDAGHPDLLRIAQRDFESDGISAEHLCVTGGALDGIWRALAAHLRPGDRVAVEDPGFPSVFYLLASLGLASVSVAVDDLGPIASSLDRVLREGVQALIVTPRAQNPYGAALDEARAAELRSVLRRHRDVLVIEDDHAGAVAGAPARTLCDAALDRWAVIRSMSKAYGPDLRLAVMASDEGTRLRVEGRQIVSMRWVSFILQQLAIQLLRDRRVRREIRAAEREYSRRRTDLIRALEKHQISAHGNSGLNVWIPVRDESSVHLGLRARGFEVSRGERFRLASAPGVRVSIGAFSSDTAQRFSSALAEVLATPEGVLPV